MSGRSLWQRAIDTLAFPLRAITIIESDRWGLSALATERFDYVSRKVRGRYCLDVGCGRHNRFVVEFLRGNGMGIDGFAYAGLAPEQIVTDWSVFPFPSAAFDAVTFIANLNHVPRSLRDAELAEAFRVLRPRGVIVVTMGNPIAELLVHRVIRWHDRLFGTHYDVDGERGMEEGEAYYLTDSEIRERLASAGFVGAQKQYFLTQWGLNHLIAARKPESPSR